MNADRAAIARVRGRVADQRRRRHILSSHAAFDVRIGGDVVARIDGRNVGVRFPVPTGATIIEVVGSDQDGRLLVATHILARDQDGDLVADTSEVAVNRRLRFSFVIDVGSAEEDSHVFCTVGVSHAARFTVPTSRGSRRVPLPAWVAIAASAGLIVVAGGVSWRNVQLREEMRLLQARLAAVLPMQPERLEVRLRPASEQVTVKAIPELVAVSLVPGLDRNVVAGVTSRNSLTLPTGTRSVAVSLVLEGPEYPAGYRAAVERPAGTVLHQVAVSKAVTSGGTRTVRFTVPAELLKPGGYIVRLDGVEVDGARHFINDYRLRVSVAATVASAVYALVVENETDGPAIMTIDGQSTIVPFGTSSVAMPATEAVVTIQARCGSATASPSPRKGEGDVLTLRCESR